jgi:hypothetical protein
VFGHVTPAPDAGLNPEIGYGPADGDGDRPGSTGRHGSWTVALPGRLDVRTTGGESDGVLPSGERRGGSVPVCRGVSRTAASRRWALDAASAPRVEIARAGQQCDTRGLRVIGESGVAQLAERGLARTQYGVGRFPLLAEQAGDLLLHGTLGDQPVHLDGAGLPDPRRLRPARSAGECVYAPCGNTSSGRITALLDSSPNGAEG